MIKPLRVLIVEDSADVTRLLLKELTGSDFAPSYERVDNAAAMRLALDRQEWDVIVADFNMPGFPGLDALKLVRQKGLDLPFIMVSDEAGEENAAVAMKAGARDYITKSNLKRFSPAVERELEVTAKLKQTAELLQAIFNNNPVGLYIVQEGKFSFTNPAFQKQTGYSQAELLGMNPLSLVVPEDRDTARENAIRALKEKSNTPYEYRGINRSGDVKWILETVAPIQYQGRRATLGIFMDINERKQTEEKLRESERKLKTLFEILPLGVSVLNAERNIVYMNPALGRILDISMAGLFKGDYRSRAYLKPDGTLMLAEEYASARAIKEQGAVYNVETGVVKEDGSVIWTNVSAVPVAFADWKVVIVTSDITKFKQAEEEIASLARFPSENPHPILRVAKDGTILYANRVSSPLLDLWKCRVGQHLPEDLYKDVLDVLDAGTSKDTEVYGDDHVFSLTLTPVADAGYVNIYFYDITNRKKVEESLRKSEENFHSSLNESPLGIRIISAQGKDLYVNQTLLDMLGYGSLDELEELNLTTLYKTDSATQSLKRREKRLRGEAPYENYRVESIRKDGQHRTLEVFQRQVLWNGEKQFQLLYNDITEQMQAEKALRESEERFRDLANLLPQTIFEIDDRGNFTFVNRQALATTGYTEEDLKKGLSAFQMVIPQDRERIARNMQRRLNGEEGGFTDYTALRKDGTTFPVSIYVSPITRENRTVGLRGIIIDMTERKQMEAQLVVTDRLASIGELASGIAHELNNPLTAIIGFSELLLNKNVPDEIKEDLSIIHREAERTAGVVKGLLTFARKHKEARSAVNINETVRLALDLRAYEHKLRNIRVVTRFAPDLPLVQADNFQLQQAFFNIIINAEYFMTETHGKGILSIATEQVGNIIRITFTDDGPGIAPETIGHIFDPFFTTKEVGKGTGLGLSICHGIISAHDGKIYAESIPGQGATFIVELPLTSHGSAQGAENG